MRISTKKDIIKNFSKKPIDFILLAIVFTMLALGIIMVLSASSPKSVSETGNSYGYVKTQSISAVSGIIIMFFISKIDYRIFKKFTWWIYILVCFLLLIVHFIGVESGRC